MAETSTAAEDWLLCVAVILKGPGKSLQALLSARLKSFQDCEIGEQKPGVASMQ